MSDPTERYLFDPDAPPTEDVRRIESALAPLRFEPGELPTPLIRPRGRRVVAAILSAAAAILLFAAGASFWLWSWPSERSWKVESGPVSDLAVGETVGADTPFLVRVARIGWMRVGEGSVLTLLSTESNRHRLAMTSGTLHVSIWAPPRSVAVTTPAGEVVDFGCEFILRVEPGRTSVDVVSGWVRLDNASGEMLVPGGAASEMTPAGGPSVPLFHSAAADFRKTIRELEAGPVTEEAIATASRTARRRDVITLLRMAERYPAVRDAFVVRAAELMPPRSSATVTAARNGDVHAVDVWVGELPLPPVNRWVPNWRDRLLRR